MKHLNATAKKIIEGRLIDRYGYKNYSTFLDSYLYDEDSFDSLEELYTTVETDFDTIAEVY